MSDVHCSSQLDSFFQSINQSVSQSVSGVVESKKRARLNLCQ
jgi:hypothetical protein